MMQKNKELLNFIERIKKILNQEKKENKWFHDELALYITKKIITEKDTGIKLSAVTIKEIGNIDKYLEKKIIPIIDYSKITDVRTECELQRDAIEMGKYRMSYYESGINFKKFCKYAHFQAEGLINYYYTKISNGDIDIAKERISNNNTGYQPSQSHNHISDIAYRVKLYAISRELSLSYKKNECLRNISYIRNHDLHRGNFQNSEEPLEQFIKEENFNRVYDSIIHLKDKIVNHLNNSMNN